MEKMFSKWVEQWPERIKIKKEEQERFLNLIGKAGRKAILSKLKDNNISFEERVNELIQLELHQKVIRAELERQIINN